MRNFKKKVKEKFINFFDWVNGAELVELNSCNTQDDPVRPELDMKFRTSYGRKIFAVKYKKEICAIMCFGFAAFNKNKTGLKKIPPPIPTMPEIKPITPPIKIEKI